MVIPTQLSLRWSCNAKSTLFAIYVPNTQRYLERALGIFLWVTVLVAVFKYTKGCCKESWSNRLCWDWEVGVGINCSKRALGKPNSGSPLCLLLVGALARLGFVPEERVCQQWQSCSWCCFGTEEADTVSGGYCQLVFLLWDCTCKWNSALVHVFALFKWSKGIELFWYSHTALKANLWLPSCSSQARVQI